MLLLRRNGLTVSLLVVGAATLLAAVVMLGGCGSSKDSSQETKDAKSRAYLPASVSVLSGEAVKPKEIRLGNHSTLEDIEWKTWGGTEAHGQGYQSNTCRVSCSSGEQTITPMKIAA